MINEGLWQDAVDLGKAALTPEIEGWANNWKRIGNVGLVRTIDAGNKRGAPVGAASGAAGGAALAGSVASGGLFNRPFQAFKNSMEKTRATMDKNILAGKPSGGSAKSRILKALLSAGINTGGNILRTAGAAGVGGGLGGVLGWKGGREAGAALASAGALGSLPGLIIGPKAGLAAGVAGAFAGSELMRNMDLNRRRETQGGGIAT